ncbi:MAG TPA: homogentisate 1,2-dioxygenase [Acidimicrobiales bacterium]|nr:homogentisate 1,2-dioxygenase [Acidimicrobiales bacterium]
MPYYRRAGELPRKRHSRFPQPGGGLYAEELMGEEGFSSASALLYHRHSPSAIVAAEEVAGDDDCMQPNRPLLPRHFRTHQVGAGGDLVTSRQLLVGNDDLRAHYAVAGAPSPLYRNAVGDEVVFVEEGSAVIESVFGTLELRQGDYAVVPMSTTHRYVPHSATVRALVLEARGHVHPPRRYLSDEGQFLEHAPYSERDLRAPTEPLLVEEEGVDVLVRHRNGLTRYVYAHHPFDVVGWDGCLYPYALSIHDFEPIVKRFHAPPPVHQTFEGPNFVVCSFCPRPFDFDPDAVPVPYHHANVDSDEVLFYVGGDFMSRRGAGIERGSMTLHPAGFVHGPQPGSAEAAIGAAGTDEVAVMVDTFRPLRIAAAARAAEDAGYAWTWSRRST